MYILFVASVWMKRAKIRAPYAVVKNSHIFRLNCPIPTETHKHEQKKKSPTTATLILRKCKRKHSWKSSMNSIWIPTNATPLFWRNDNCLKRKANRRCTTDPINCRDEAKLSKHLLVLIVMVRWRGANTNRMNRISAVNGRQSKTVRVYLFCYLKGKMHTWKRLPYTWLLVPD